MGKLIDLTGQRFGRLKVIERTDDYIFENGDRKVRWLCLCDCGNETLVVTQGLRGAGTKSCGCLKAEAAHNANFIDLTGQYFGRLFVIRVYGINNNKKIQYTCKCSCGNETVVCGSSLKSGGTKSCGCLTKEASRNFINIVGKTYARLTVIERAENKVAKNGKIIVMWRCKCECGNEKIFRGAQLKNGNTKSCGCIIREKSTNSVFIDLTGKKFGKLTAIKRVEDYIPPNGVGIPIWFCECDCGNTTKVQGRCLRDGTTVSCGCLRESTIATEMKNFYIKNYSATDEYLVFKNPETSRWLPYDIYIPCGENPNLNGIYIEIHGLQHYKFVSHYHISIDGFKNQKKKDRMKRKFARNNGMYIEVDLRKIKTTAKALDYVEKITGGINVE